MPFLPLRTPKRVSWKGRETSVARGKENRQLAVRRIGGCLSFLLYRSSSPIFIFLEKKFGESSRYEVEFDFAYRYSISLLTAHFHKLLDNTAQAQYFLEIQHRIGIVQNDVTAKHIH